MPPSDLLWFLPHRGGLERKGYGRTAALISLTDLFTTVNGREFGAWVEESRTFTVGIAANEVLTDLDHHWGDGTPVRVSTSSTLPAPLVVDTTYWVVQAELTSSLNEPSRILKLSTTKGGS